MTDNTQRLIREIFDAAAEIPAADREAWVAARAQGNHEIIANVIRLLRASRASGGAFLAEPAWKREQVPALQKGMMIGPYRVLRELGAGGMGVVYLTMRSDEVFRRLAALKVIRPELLTGPLKNRFLQERDILARLDHQNIARIIDGGTTAEGLPYFVMDYVDGLPLDVFCRERRASMQQRLNLFRQTCEAVQYLHENNVLHRDLKPANILVTHNGQVKLLDFGVSKLTGEGASTKTTGMPILTAGYASPEQITSKKVTPASDIYSLGVVLYELLTGVRPLTFDGLGLPEILTSIATKAPAKPSTQQPLSEEADPGRVLTSMRPQLAGDLDSILLMALRKEPERRYRSAAEFSSDVERYQTGRSVIARGDAHTYLAGRTIRRHRGKIAASLILCVALAFGSVATYQAIAARNQVRALEQEVIEMRSHAAEAQSAQTPATRAQLQNDLNKLATDYATKTPAILRNRLVPKAATKQLVQQSLAYFDDARVGAGNDPSTVASLGRAYLAVAQTQWSPDQASLNDQANAAHTCFAALKILAASQRLSKSAEVQQVAGRITSILEQNPATRQ